MLTWAVRARARLDPVQWDFFAGGAGSERTLRANESAFARRFLLPRILRGPGPRDLRTSLLGSELSMPVLIAPTAFHRLAHPAGESGTARAAAAAGTVMTVSMAATEPIERIAAAGGTLWFQIYPQPDRAFTESVVKRAEAAGCRALVVTVDSPVFGHRSRDLRNGFTDLPAGLRCENMRDATGSVRDIAMDDSLSWDTIAWLRGVTGLPILLKGVLHPADARLAVSHGVDGLIVSNHGGRQLDGALATLDALPAVVDAVHPLCSASPEGSAIAGPDLRKPAPTAREAERSASPGGSGTAGSRLPIPVLVDGGVRSGADVLVAMAMGASAVLIGRPVIWGLAAGGEAGVRGVLDRFAEDLDHVLALAGARTPADLDPSFVVHR